MIESIQETLLFWPCQRDPEGGLWVLDETRLPLEISFLPVRRVEDAVALIRDMKTRAFGQFLVVVETLRLVVSSSKKEEVGRRIEEAVVMLNRSRPTFPFAEITGMMMEWWRRALTEVDPQRVFHERSGAYLEQIRSSRLQRVRHLASLLEKGDRILTHCHVSGEMAMAAALAARQGRNVFVAATETRPYCQGARLTCFELAQMGVEHALIPDACAAAVMAAGMIDKLVVGSDRNCANGDFANKIGTYALVSAARRFGVKVIVLTQPSRRLASMDEIPIEMRPAEELLVFQGRRLFEEDVEALYPSFDVVPGEWIDEAVALSW